MQGQDKKKLAMAMALCLLAIAIAAFMGVRTFSRPKFYYPPGYEHSPEGPPRVRSGPSGTPGSATPGPH